MHNADGLTTEIFYDEILCRKNHSEPLTVFFDIVHIEFNYFKRCDDIRRF